MPILQFPTQPKVPLRARSGSGTVWRRSIEEVLRRGNRALLLECSISVSEWHRPPGKLIEFPKPAHMKDGITISD